MPSKMFWWHLPEHLIANLIYLLYYALRGRGKVLLKAKTDALFGLSTMLKKRKEIQSRRKVSDADLVQKMQHGWLKPYLLGYHLRRARKS
jgi:hypothetical protein